jgi:hypothetical protein
VVIRATVHVRMVDDVLVYSVLVVTILIVVIEANRMVTTI